MKRVYLYLVLGVIFAIPTTSFADIKYVNGDIRRIEVCAATTEMVFIFLENSVGTAPSISNGCSNDTSFPYIRLEPDSTSEIKKSMYALALSAYMAGKKVRIRYDDTDSLNYLVAIAFL